VPIVPISTGTNNVFPSMIEGTLAGVAAGLVARGLARDAVDRVACLEITRDGAEPEVALIDVAVYDERFVATRALWDPRRILELVLARFEPGCIGLSSIGAHLGLDSTDGTGLYVRMGDDGPQVHAPIAPGIVARVGISEYRVLGPGDEACVCQPRPCTLAFDGERDVELAAGTRVRVKLDPHGPRVVDVQRAIGIGARAGAFTV
jgi:hypothetical protein